MSLVRRLWGSVRRTGHPSLSHDAEAQARRLSSQALNALDVTQARNHLAPVMAHAAEPETYCLHARLLLVDGEVQAAFEDLLKAQALDGSHPTVLDEFATFFLHTGDPVRELEFRKRRLQGGAGLTLSHVLATTRAIAQLGPQSASMVEDVKQVAALFRRFEPIASQAEKLEFAECLYSLGVARAQARDRVQACLPPQPGEQRTEIRLRAATELLSPEGVLTHPDDRLVQTLILEQASVLPGVQWCPWLPGSATAPHGFFTRRLRTAREDARSQLLLHSPACLMVRVPAGAPRQVAGTSVLIGGLDNYYHFIAEHLGRLASLDALGVPASGSFLVVPAQLPAFARELLHLAGYGDDHLIPVGTQDHLVFERLIAPLPPVRGGAEVSAALPAWIRRTYASYMLPGEPLKLYVSRARAGRRGITNEQEVVDHLRHHGFEVVYPEELDVRQQIAMYSRAREVVAPGGAALTNMVFMPEGSRMTMINNRHLPPEAQNLFFEPLARVCGVRFSIVSGTARKFNTNRVLDADVEVPMNELCAALGIPH